MGTAFLCCHESGASPAHQRFLLQQHELGTAYTRAFSGRRAQGIANRFIRQMQDQPYLPFPIQNTLTGALRQKAVREDDADYQSLWAGSNYAKVRAMSVADLINQLSKEYSQTN
jgi:nitronate monooxygenase